MTADLWRRPAAICYRSSMPDDERTEVERLRAENERLRRTASRGITLKVSEKGGVSVYGLGRFPVTLYKEQWVKLLDMADEIRAFITENEAALKSKA
jgi:hypothetical protein